MEGYSPMSSHHHPRSPTNSCTLHSACVQPIFYRRRFLAVFFFGGARRTTLLLFTISPPTSPRQLHRNTTTQLPPSYFALLPPLKKKKNNLLLLILTTAALVDCLASPFLLSSTSTENAQAADRCVVPIVDRSAHATRRKTRPHQEEVPNG